MEKIYLPINSVNDYSCYTIYNKDTIRAFKTEPVINGTSEYTDFYITSHYININGVQSWGNWNTSLPVCLDKSIITTDYYYRFDFSDILIIFSIIAIVVVLIPFKIFSRLFGRWLKV